MRKIGITGQNGFLGTHLKNAVCLRQESVLIPFQRTYFNNAIQMRRFVENCDVIFHTAAIIKHDDSDYLKSENLRLLNQLLSAMEGAEKKPRLVLTSSIQEGDASPYGVMKKAISDRVREWNKKHRAEVFIFQLPNLFGPFAKPYHNSVVATFCESLAKGKRPTLIDNKELPLVYVEDVVSEFMHIALLPSPSAEMKISWKPNYTKVSEVLALLLEFHELYFERGEMPGFSNLFQKRLFSTYLTYLPETLYPRPLHSIHDDRGWFMETVKSHGKGQFSISSTHPGIIRGHHFHTRKIERFIIVQGKAEVSWRRYGSDEVQTFLMDGASPSYIDIPIWHTHAIKNIGNETLIMLFWIDEMYDEDDADTYKEIV